MVNIPGEPPYPLGVYKDPPPADFSLIDSHNVGGSLPANFARTATTYANKLHDLYDSLVPGL